MKFLVTGATDLPGSAVVDRLLAGGHCVVGFAQTPPLDDARSGLQWSSGDFGRRGRAKHWRADLPGIDVVIHTHNMFREPFPHTFGSVHDEATAALVNACANYGVRRVVHLSALGADAEAPTEYWRSKWRGEQHVLAHREYERWIVRTPVLFTESGRWGQVLRLLASMPVILLPRTAGPVQPLHVEDLADLLVLLATQGGPGDREIIEAAGPAQMLWEDWIAALRAKRGQRPAPILKIPRAWAKALAGFMERSTSGLIAPASITMLCQGCLASPGSEKLLAELLHRDLRQPY